MSDKCTVIYEARELARHDLDAAILRTLDLGELSASDIRGMLALELTQTRRVAGRLRSLAHRGLVRSLYNAFVSTTSWCKVTTR